MIENINKILNENGCNRLILSSSFVELKKVMDKLGRFDYIIEIGTHNGLSTTVLTHYCKRVFTFDIASRNAEYIWNLFKVRHKISSFVGSSIKYEIDYICKEWKERGVDFNFNLAFIDGWHEYYSVKADFEMVKFCGKVLFHDFVSSGGVKHFCKEIGAKRRRKNFALWEN